MRPSLAFLMLSLVVACDDYADKVPASDMPATPTNAEVTTSEIDTSVDTSEADVEPDVEEVGCTTDGACSGLDDECNRGKCNTATGECFREAINEAGTCDDHLRCTLNDVCTNGTCAGTAKSCAPAGVCDAEGACNEETGDCVRKNAENGKPCDDALFCTIDDVCADGVCSGKPRVCDDQRACSVDLCDDSGDTCTADLSPCECETNSDCDDANPCNGNETCGADGKCASGTPVSCAAFDAECGRGVCNPEDGQCATQPLSGGTCDDEDACTPNDTCAAGVCKGGARVTCPAQDACHDDGTCNAATGACLPPAKDDGTACDDGRICTEYDKCTGGVCGGDAITCDDGLGCSVDACDDQLGGCVADLSNCQCPPSGCSDGNPCNGVETCDDDLGRCVLGTPVDCSAFDAQCLVGTCDAGTGLCSAQPRGPGTTCNDGNACTSDDTCIAGLCLGSSKICAPLDQCHDAGSCNAQTGECSNPFRSGECNDDNVCTPTDVCVLGQCVGQNAVQCNALDQCHIAGTCNPQSGVCSNPIRTGSCNDNNACTQVDACSNGNCVGSQPVQCNALDACHSVGVCQPGSGQCTNPERINGTPCEDGNGCTLSDSCLDGACKPGAPKSCSAPACGENPTCNPTNGQCSFEIVDNGTDCNDGTECTIDDDCQSGVCAGDALPPCLAVNECHTNGNCNAQTGICSTPTKPNNTPCTPDGCFSATCQAGECKSTGISTCPPGETCGGEDCACEPTATSFATNVRPILTSSCATSTCHRASSPDGGLVLEANVAYQNIVNVASAQCPGRIRVKPNDVDGSYLMDKIRGVDICSGGRMPASGSITSAQIATIGRWICQGAQNN